MDGRQNVTICDTEPIAIEGMRAVLEASGDFRLAGAETSLIGGRELVREHHPLLVVLDKAFGLGEVAGFMRFLHGFNRPPSAIVWGASLSGAEALRLLQAGAQGIIRKRASVREMLACLRSVAAGNPWMEEDLFHASEHMPRSLRASLTARELQVVELIEQGMKNRDIAVNLGIRTGTVKIHVKHIFEKTGIRGRYGLALTGLKEKGLLSLPEDMGHTPASS